MPGIPTGDFNPIYNVPMLGTHKRVLTNRLPMQLFPASSVLGLC
jgi:hypothetical protein